MFVRDEGERLTLKRFCIAKRSTQFHMNRTERLLFSSRAFFLSSRVETAAVYHVTCRHHTEATFNGLSSPPSLVHPYNTIGNENLPCNLLLFIIIFVVFLPFHISVNISNFCSCDISRDGMNGGSSSYCNVKAL